MSATMTEDEDNETDEEIDIVIDNQQLPQHAPTFILGVENLHIHEYPSQDDLEEISRENVSRIASDLKAELRHRVGQISSVVHAPCETLDTITPVTLPMVSAPQRMDDDLNSPGHFHRRDDMKKMYDPHPGDVTVEQIFEWARRRAEVESRSWFRDENLRRNYVVKYGNVVGVVGQAGIGKTTTAKQWARKALDESVFGEVSFLFLITARYLNYTTPMSLLQFLVSSASSEWSCPPESERGLIEMIASDSRVLIIVDGMDEAAFESFTTEVHHSSLHGTDTAEAYLKNLMAGNILPLARKIVTSRPSQFYNLHRNYRPHFTVQLLGLDRELQRDLGVQMCGEQQYRGVEAVLRASPNVFAYCFVPINFILTVNYIMNFGTETPFISIARVLSFTCNQFFHSDHVHTAECEVGKLAALAWHGVLRNKIVFSAEDLENFELSHATRSAFLNTCMATTADPSATVTERNRFHCFSHLIWQEKFAAAHLMFAVPLQEFCATVPVLLQHRRDVVIMFLYGLFDPISYNQMSCVLGRATSTADREAKLQYMRNSIRFVLQSARESSHLLRVCSWLHEANDRPLTVFAAQFLPQEIQLSGAVLPVDMSNLVFVLKAIDRPLSISMVRCRMQENSLEIFARSYAAETNIWMLNMSYVAFSTEDCQFLTLFLHSVTNLLVRDCEIRPNEILIISRALQQLDHKMRYLDLTENKLRIRGARNFAPCVSKIESLDLTKCLMVAEGISAIALEVAALEEPMEYLCVDENLVSDEGAASMADCLHNTRNLRMCNCGIEGLGAEYLAEKLALLQQPMTSLWLSSNKLGDDGARSLAPSLGKVREVHLDYCYIGNRGAKKIAKELAKLNEPLLYLDLTGNTISDEGTEWLAGSWRKVRRLVLSGCNTSDECRDRLQAQLGRESMSGHVVEF